MTGKLTATITNTDGKQEALELPPGSENRPESHGVVRIMPPVRYNDAGHSWHCLSLK